MNEEQAAAFLKLIGSKKVVTGKAGWVVGNCPFAATKHESGTDHKPSFGIAVGEKRMSFYNCLSCHSKGSVASLPMALTFLYERDYTAAQEFVSKNETFARSEVEDEGYLVELAPCLNDSVMNKFKRAKREMYADRQITVKMAQEVELMFDITETRLIFPIRDKDGRLVGIRGRYLGTTESMVRYRDYSELSPSGKACKAFGVWYGENYALKRDKMLVLVEGEFDALALRQAGLKNVWGAMGSALSPLQVKNVKEARLPTLIFFDNDRSGKLATANLIRELKGLPLYIVRRYFGCNDPCDLHVTGKLKDALATIDKVDQS